MQFAMALMNLSANKPVEIIVKWEGRRATLTEKLFVANVIPDHTRGHRQQLVRRSLGAR
jgi:hypothetical protein